MAAGLYTTLGMVSHLGRIYETLHENDQAKEYYEQALSILRETGDRRGEARVLNHLGWVYSHLEEKKQVREYYREGLSILRDVGDQLGEGLTLYDLGFLYLELCQYRIALACFLFAKKVFNEMQSPYYEATQNRIATLRETVGEEQFTALLATVE